MTNEELDARSSTEPTDATPGDGDQTSAAAAEVVAEVAEESIEEESGALDQELEAAREALAEAEKKAAEYLSGWQRSQASFENFRKRTTAEQAQWRSTANAALLGRLLPVLDDFRRAFAVVPDAIAEDPWLNGIELVERKVQTILETENVQEITVETGDLFDPNYHEAVLYQVVPGFDEGQIVAVVEVGYMLGDRVLRPSMVVIAKGVEPAPIEKAAPAETDVEAPAKSEADAAQDA